MNGRRHSDSLGLPEDELYRSSSQSQLLSSSTSSISSAKQNSQTYKHASQLFLTRRLQESLSTLEPLITVPAAVDGSQQPNGDSEDIPTLAPIASFSSTLRIKVWNLYITLLSAIVDLGPEDGKNELGQKEWKSLASKVREGEIWEMIVQVGYRGMEGSVDADVVYNLATLLLSHSPSQTLNQQRLENYLSSYGQPDLDIVSHMQNPDNQRRRMRTSGGTDTPKDLASRVKILELFTLHVLPRNEEWDYAREFINLSEVLDEEKKELFLQTLDGLRDEKERGIQRAAEIQQEKDAEFERQRVEEEKRKAEEEKRQRLAAPATTAKSKPSHRKTSSEVDYGIDKSLPNGVSKVRNQKPPPSGRQTAGSGSRTVSGRAQLSPPPPPESSKSVKKVDRRNSVVGRVSALAAMVQNIIKNMATSVSSNPMSYLRTMLFIMGLVIALSRKNVRDRIKRVAGAGWEKVRKTAGMGVKVSYI
ncbi:hypothetical protein FQN54_007933 [Arachnomyces sp. PD_36]|nr:hypothetical protein FQN54_007933 [Arachnomyces sp. PD_36]